MEKLTPYVNMETIKYDDGKVKKFKVRTICYLPKDSKITKSGDEKMADNVIYRPLTIEYTGTSEEYDYFGVDFKIKREDVGLLERGIIVSIKQPDTKLLTYESNRGNPVDYQDGGMV